MTDGSALLEVIGNGDTVIRDGTGKGKRDEREEGLEKEEEGWEMEKGKEGKERGREGRKEDRWKKG